MSYEKMSYEANKASLEGKEPVAEVKTTVYADTQGSTFGTTGTQSSGSSYAADLVDRTEGNQNWGETGGEFRSTTYGQQDLKDMANETASVAHKEAPISNTNVKLQEGKIAANAKLQEGKQVANAKLQEGKQVANEKLQEGKSALSQAVETGKEKFNQATTTAGHQVEAGKARLGQDVEIGKEKLGQTYNAAGERLHEAKDYTVETTQSMVDKLKDAAGNTATTLQHKTHEWAETAQHTLEQAREKAREVFTGAGQKVDEAQYKMSGPGATTYQAGDATEIKVKATENPTGGIDNIKVEAKATNAQ